MSWLTNIFSKNETVPKSENPQKTAADYCEQGEKSLANGKYVEAMEFFQAAIETDRRYEKAYLLLVASYEKQGNMVKAKATLFALLAIDPENGAALKKLEQLSQTPQPKKNNDTPTEISSEEAPPTPQSNNTKSTQTNSNYSTNFRVIASTDSDVFDFFIVFDNGNRLYLKKDDEQNSAAIVPPTKYGWEGYKMPLGLLDIPPYFYFEGQNYQVIRIAAGAFNSCKDMSSIRIPDTVTTIESYAFHKCTSLISIVLPINLKKIGDECFSSCSFDHIIIPNSVRDIGNGAFSSCKQLASFTFPSLIKTVESFVLIGCEKLTKIIIPRSVCEIKEYAFGDISAFNLGANEVELRMESPTPPRISSKIFPSSRTSYRGPIRVTVIVPKGASEAYMNAQYWQLYDIQEK